MLDKLQLLRCQPYKINDAITIYQPFVGDIAEFGESHYWSIIADLTATSYDFRFQLNDAGVDYVDVSDFMMFSMVCQMLSPEDTRLIFGDLDLNKFKLYGTEEDPFLEDDNGVIIDPVIYELIVSYLRDVYGLKRNFRTSGNAMARKYHLEEERKQLERKLAADKEAGKKEESMLGAAISAMVNNTDFKYDYNTIWDLPIYVFLDAVNRLQKNLNYKNLMTGIYTGNIDAKKIPNSQLSWIGEA